MRQLTFTIGDGVNQGADTIIQGAASQSNHCRQAAAASAKLGLKCYLRLSRDNKSVRQGNVLLDDLAGADVEFVDASMGAELDAVKYALAEELKEKGLKPLSLLPLDQQLSPPLPFRGVSPKSTNSRERWGLMPIGFTRLQRRNTRRIDPRNESTGHEPETLWDCANRLGG